MPQRVFHQRLEQKIRNEGIQCFRGNLQLHRQAVAQTDFFQIGVTLVEFQFLGQGPFLGAVVVQGHAQQFT